MEKLEKTIKIEKICKELGITTHAYHARKQRGWTEEETMLVPKMGAIYVINGEPAYKYLKRVGGSYSALLYRLRNGMNFEEAVKAAEKTRGYKRRKKNEM